MVINGFEGSNMEELAQLMFVQIKTQVENPRMPESGTRSNHSLTYQLSQVSVNARQFL